MEILFQHLPYVAVAGILLLSGFGLPLPEDLPLLMGGYLCGQDQAHLAIMLPLCLASVLGADLIMFAMGRQIGMRLTRLPLLRRFLTPARIEKAAEALHGHSGKTLFTARFLPGLRTPIFFTAGTFGIPFWKMLVFDGVAALISVPAWVLAAYFFAGHLEALKELSRDVQLGLLTLAVLLAVGLLMWKWRRRRQHQAIAGRTVVPEVISKDRAA